MQNLLRRSSLIAFSILTLCYAINCNANTPFTLCNGDATDDQNYYHYWKEKCKQITCDVASYKPKDFNDYMQHGDTICSNKSYDEFMEKFAKCRGNDSQKCKEIDELYTACIRENASDTCDMPYQDMRAEIIGGKFILKRRNVKEVDKWDVIKHKPSFALKLIAKPELETDWGDYVFIEVDSQHDVDIFIKEDTVIKCKIKDVC